MFAYKAVAGIATVAHGWVVEVIEEIDNDFTNKIAKKTRQVIFENEKGKIKK